MVLYTNPMSRGRVVRWALEEIGQPYECRVLEYGASIKAPEYLAVNPMGKVPAIQHNGAVVTESVAICTYLADAFPEAKLAPDAADYAARADYYRWLFFVAGPLEAATTTKSLGVTVEKNQEAFVGFGCLDQVVQVLENLLRDKTYIAGNRFSMADLIMSAYLSFYMDFEVLPKNPVFVAYVQKHKNRPAALRAEQMDNELAAAQSKAG